MSADNAKGSDVQKAVVKKPSLKLNAVSNWGPLGVNFVVGLLLTPYLIGHLGKGGYGVWALVGSLLGYYGLLRLGVGAGIMRYVPFYRGMNDQSAASQIVSTAMAMFLVVGLAILLISILLAEPIARFYKAGPELASLIRILGVAAALECPQRILDACIRSHEHWIAANFITIASAIGRALGLVGCVYWGYGVVEMGYVVVAVTLFSFVFVYFLFARFCPDIQLHPSMVKLSHVQTLISFGILATVISVVYSLTMQGHSLIIGKLISLEALTVYFVAGFFMRNIQRALMAPVRVFWPRFAYLDGRGHSDEVASLFLRGTRLTAIFASGVMFIVFVLGPSFIRLWVGEEFQAGEHVLPWLAAGYLISTSQGIIGPLLSATGRQKKRALIAVAEGIIGFTLSLLLGWRIGMLGVAIGFTVSSVLISGLVLPWYVCHILRVDFLRYYLRYLGQPWVILLTFVTFDHFVHLGQLVTNWAVFVLLAFGLVLTYAAAIVLIVIDDTEKRSLFNFLQQYVLRFTAH